MTRRRSSLAARCWQAAGTLLVAIPAAVAGVYGLGRLVAAAAKAVGLP